MAKVEVIYLRIECQVHLARSSIVSFCLYKHKELT